MNVGLYGQLQPPAEALEYAIRIGEIVALGSFTMEQGIDLIHLLPGPAGTERIVDPRNPGRPTLWMTDSKGYRFRHGFYTQLCWAMRDADSAMSRKLQKQEIDARKVVAPLLARGVHKSEVTAAVRCRCPDLPAETVSSIVDEEAAWWLRWRHDHGFGDPSGDNDDQDFEGAA
jgi:hypothetical protein